MLKLWYPFTTDKRNQGLSSPTVAHDVITIEDNGKLGKCGNGGMVLSGAGDLVGNTWTIALWAMSNNWNQNNDILACKNIADASHCNFYFSIINKSSLNIGINTGSNSFTYPYSFENGLWYHLAATYDGKTCVLYINGDQVKSKDVNNTAFTDCTNIGICSRSADANGETMAGSNSKYVNDFRLYDTALSPREIKEISKGLVLHYPLSGVTPKQLYGEDFTYVDGVPTLSGNPIQFTSPAKLPVEGATVSWEPVQYGDGDPSTTNVRYIQAQPLTLFACGKNIWNEDDFLYVSGIKKDDDGWYYAGSATWRAAFLTTSNGLWHMNHMELPQITISFDYYTTQETSTSNALLLYAYYDDGTYTYTACTCSTEIKHARLTSQADKKVSAVTISYSVASTVYIKNFQIEFGAEETEYEPFRGEVINVGQNLIDKANLENGYINSTGNIVNTTGWYHTDYIPITPGQTYIGSSISKGGSGTYYALYNAKKEFSRAVKITANANPIFHSEEDEYYVRMSIRDLSNEVDTACLTDGYAAGYADYTCGQVYGGSFDLTTGILTKTYECLTLNGDETWQVVSASGDGAAYYRHKVSEDNYIIGDTCMCDKIPIASIGSSNKNIGINAYRSSDGNSYVAIRLDETNSTNVVTWLSENPVQITFKLVTPVTYTISPTQFNTVVGMNNIFVPRNGVLQFTDPRAEALGLTDDVVYDVSGYQRNSEEITGHLTIVDNAPRYYNAMNFDGSSYIVAESLPAETQAVSFWIKTTWKKISSGYQLAFHDINSKLCAGFTTAGLVSYIGTSNGSTGSYVLYDDLYTENEWNHIAIIKTGEKTRTVYVNGQEATPRTNSYFNGNGTKLKIGCRYYNSYRDYFTGQISDFRAYATQLSAADVLELYHTPEILANNGTLLTQGEYVES